VVKAWTQAHWEGLGNQIKAAMSATIATASQPVWPAKVAEDRCVEAKALGATSEWRTAPWDSM
jgi:hypothetical protein